jgi:hypothetical protein
MILANRKGENWAEGVYKLARKSCNTLRTIRTKLLIFVAAMDEQGNVLCDHSCGSPEIASIGDQPDSEHIGTTWTQRFSGQCRHTCNRGIPSIGRDEEG